MRKIDEALSILYGANIPTKKTSYGFSLQHEELSESDFAQCGMDNDSSISLSVNVKEDPPTAWFFRIDFLEMAQFIVDAYKATKKEDPARDDIISAMREIDASYDDRDLDKMTDKFLSDTENN